MSKKFNKRSWLENRFKGLYPGVMKDLSNICTDCLEFMVDEIQVKLIRKELDLDNKEDKQKLADMLGYFRDEEIGNATKKLF